MKENCSLDRGPGLIQGNTNYDNNSDCEQKAVS